MKWHHVGREDRENEEQVENSKTWSGSGWVMKVAGA